MALLLYAIFYYCYRWKQENVNSTISFFFGAALVEYDPQYQNVCLDEKPVVLHVDVHSRVPVEPGKPERVDDEYERRDRRNLFVMVEPRACWRHVEVTAQRISVLKNS